MADNRSGHGNTGYRRMPSITATAWSPFHIAAIDYFEQGFLPIPLPMGRKYPPPAGTPNSIEVTEKQLAEWLRDSRPKNIGTIVPDGMLVIDVDGIAGEESLKELEAKYGRLKATWMSFRGDVSRYHLWYRTPKGIHWPGKLGTGIDLIHRHYRYAVIPPSIHPDGSQYRWISI